MDFYQLLSIISFSFSTYLAIDKIYNSKVRASVEIINLFSGDDGVVLKFSINNLSSNSIAITEATLSNKQSGLIADSAHYYTMLIDLKKKTKGEVTDSAKLFTDQVPLNITQKSAQSFYLMFPLENKNIHDFCKDILTLELQINGKFFSKNFDFISKNSPKEQLRKELKI